MIDYLVFEGPADTVFLIEGKTLRVLADDGGEVLLPWGDLLEFLVQLSVQRVQVLSRLRNHQLHLLAIALMEHN